MRMEHQVKVLHETRLIFHELKTDPKSVLFSLDELDTKLLKKLKQSPYTTGKQLVKLIDFVENKIKKIKDDKVPIRLDYVEKREIDRSVLYSFDGPFQLFHVDITNLGNQPACLIMLS